jgi:hypothetical protein
LFNIGFSARFESHGLSDQLLERRSMPRRGPEFELGIARCPHLQQPVVAAIVELDGGHRLGVAAVQTFRQSQHGRERPDDLPLRAGQISESAVPPLGCRTSMIPGDERHDLDFMRLESPQIAVTDQIVRVLVMVFVADVDADVVQQPGVLQPLPLAVGQAMDGARLVEERGRQPGDLLSVLGPVAAPFRQLDDAAAANVRIAIGLRDLLPMPGDVVQQQAFTERQVTERDCRRFQAPDDGVQQNGSGDSEIGASRFKTGDAEAPLETELGQHLANAVD